MMKTLALVLVFAASVSAQTVVATLDLSSLGWGLLATPQAIDTDGSPYTQEWLIYRLNDRRYRVVADRDGTMCPGPWFAVGPDVFFPPTVASVQRVGLVDVLMVAPGQGPVSVVRLDTPACE